MTIYRAHVYDIEHAYNMFNRSTLIKQIECCKDSNHKLMSFFHCLTVKIEKNLNMNNIYNAELYSPSTSLHSVDLKNNAIIFYYGVIKNNDLSNALKIEFRLYNTFEIEYALLIKRYKALHQIYTTDATTPDDLYVCQYDKLSVELPGYLVVHRPNIVNNAYKYYVRYDRCNALLSFRYQPSAGHHESL